MKVVTSFVPRKLKEALFVTNFPVSQEKMKERQTIDMQSVRKETVQAVENERNYRLFRVWKRSLQNTFSTYKTVCLQS